MDTFEIRRDMIDATSMNRPDTSWRHTDPAGHVHQWYTNGAPAENYYASERYDTPTLVWVKDGVEEGHLECRECRATVVPRRTADTIRQYIPGMVHYIINDVEVTQAEYELRMRMAEASDGL